MKIPFTLLFLLTATAAWAQMPDWQHKDLKDDSIFGVSTKKAYEFLKGKKSTTVLVAVIDAGIDTGHADLKPVLWTNPKETRDNKKDDDGNHYTDDYYGWSFLGSGKGNVHYDNAELTRLVRAGKQRYGTSSDTIGLATYLSLNRQFNKELNQSQLSFRNTRQFSLIIDTIVKAIGKDNPSVADIVAYEPQNATQANIKGLLLRSLKEMSGFSEFREKNIEAPLHQLDTRIKYALNPEFDPRGLVGDHYENIDERYYGTSDVTGPDATHGTHVGGIIGAVRNNGIGIDGIADNVRIMTIRAVPEGDERDKDIANAIRYAVDNGARVINMSFGKPYSPNKKAVDDAVKYAMQKDVLIIHAAGNNALNLDVSPNFPTKGYADSSGMAEAWIEVGASGPRDDGKLVAPFSNFGKRSVDVFAPGVDIYSTVPGSKYAYLSGTSMAAPVVAGVAALIRSYFPYLTARQVKDVIMRSVTHVEHSVFVPGANKRAPFSDLSVSGGVVNAFEAVKQAQELSGTSSSSTSGYDIDINRYMVKEKAPGFTLTDLQGNTVKLADLKGKVVVLDFWATWCIPCIRSLPAMQLAVNKYKADTTVRFLFIHTLERSSNATEEAATFIKNKQYNFQVLMDLKDAAQWSKVAGDYRITAIPVKLVIDPKGNIRYRVMGFMSTDADILVDELSAMIEKARAGD